MTKKITCAKTIYLSIDGAGKYYLPDDLTLRDKKILSIIPVLELYTDNDSDNILVNEAKNLYLNLTSNGQVFFYENMPVYQISNDVLRGLYPQFNETISFPNSYVTCTGNVTGNLVFVIFYEDKSVGSATKNIDSNYSYCEVPLLYSNGYRNPLPDNRVLVGKKIKNIIVSFPEFTPQGYDGVAQEEVFDRAYITLCKGSKIVWDKMPIKLLLQLEQFAMLQLQNIEFDFESSYIQIYGEDLSIENTYLYLMFEYER